MPQGAPEVQFAICEPVVTADYNSADLLNPEKPVFDTADSANRPPDDDHNPFFRQLSVSPVVAQDTKMPSTAVTEYDGPADDIVALYLKEMRSTPLLTKELEIDLVKRMEQGRVAIKALDGADTAVKRRKAEAQVSDGLAAREELIIANSRLVVSIAKKFTNRGVPLLDLIQEGNIGLISAVECFDYRRGARMSTFAYIRIRRAIALSIANQGRTIRIPVYAGNDLNRCSKFEIDFMQTNGRVPTDAEIAAFMGKTPRKYAAFRRRTTEAGSLDEPVHSDHGPDELAVYEFEPDTTALDPLEASMVADLRERVAKELHRLPEKEATVLRLYFGISPHGEACGPMVLADIGEELGFTAEYIRNIKENALNRLRLQSQVLKDY